MNKPIFESLAPVARSGRFLVLDTETTGISYGSEIVEIAIIDQDGKTLIDTRVKPKNAIPSDASAIHGITGRDVEGSPDWLTVRSLVRPILASAPCIIYNMEYDTKLLRSTDGVYKIKNEEWDMTSFHCAMLAYSEYRGEWNDYRQSWKWHKLTSACWQENIPVRGAHGAIGDCRMTLALLRKMYA